MDILVKYEDYLKYIIENQSEYLDKKNKYRIWSPSKSSIINEFKPVNEEIFNGTKTEYKLVEVESGYLITFFTNSQMEYRFDLFKEPNTNIYHLGFSISNVQQSDYEKVTDVNESIELFSRLTWILKDLKIRVDEFCIGATGNPKKDRIYEYMMRFVDSWQKRKSDHYPLGWALYFKL